MTSQRIVQLSIASTLVLLVMVGITFATGVSQETFEIVRAPRVYADELREFAMPLRALFALDAAFLVLYTCLLVGFAQTLITPATKLLIGVAIGALLVTAGLDMVEDHHILALLRGVESGGAVTPDQIAFEHTVSQVKFSASYLGLFLLGLCIPPLSTAHRLLAFLLTVGTLAQGAWLFAAPDALLPLGNTGRWIGFVVGFLLIIPVVRQAGDAVETGARA